MEKYWQQFMVSGLVEDYLSYRKMMSVPEMCHNKEEEEGKKRESDRSDRNGTIYGTDWRI